jgi:hypothetical protein
VEIEEFVQNVMVKICKTPFRKISLKCVRFMILTCTIARSSAPCKTTFPDMFHCDTVGEGNNVAVSKLVSYWYITSVPGSHSCKPETLLATTASSNTATPAHSVNQRDSDEI